MKTRKPIW